MCSVSNAVSQKLSVPQNIGTQHPRVFGKEMSLEQVKELVKKEEWAAVVITKIQNNVAFYLEHYDVYLGTVNPPTTKIGNNLTSPSLNVDLEASKNYFWEVVVKDNKGGETKGTGLEL